MSAQRPPSNSEQRETTGNERASRSDGRRSPRASRRRRAKQPITIRVDAEDTEPQELTVSQKALQEIKTGSTGYLSSLGLHLGLLLVLWILLAPGAYDLSGGGGFETNFAFIKIEQKQKKQQPGNNGIPVVKRERTPIFDNPRDKEPPKKKANPDGKPSKPAREGPPSQPVKPVGVQNLFGLRTPESKQRILKELDPEEKIRRAISYGLAWLQRQQHSAGNWKLHDPGYPDSGYQYLNTDTGATALALLAYLGDGHTHKAGTRYQKTVAKGLQWLTGIQKPNGDFHDSIERGRQTAFYAHAQATIVLCEAYALSGDDSLREPAEQGIRYLVESQNPVNGGWKYQPQEATSRGDLSVTGWALMALHSARAAGIDVPERAFVLAGKFLDSVQEQNGALYKYEPDPTPRKPTPSMTAEGLLSRQFLGWPKDHPALQEGLSYLKRPEHKPRWIAEGRKRPIVYDWYYAGHVFHNMGGKEWTPWYDHVATLIVEQQSTPRSRVTNVHGSWSPADAQNGGYYGYGYYGGRLYMTTMCLLILELPYRHQSIYTTK